MNLKKNQGAEATNRHDSVVDRPPAFDPPSIPHKEPGFSGLYRFVDPFLALIFPRDCVICGEPAEAQQDGTVCVTCWQAIEPALHHDFACSKCAWPRTGSYLRAEHQDRGADVPNEITLRAIGVVGPRASGEPDEFCHRCRFFELDQIRFVGPYRGALRSTVLMLKHHPVIPARVISWMRGSLASHFKGQEHPVLIPVPLHRRRHAERGFNQAEVIAGAISRVTRWRLETGVLIRQTETRRHRAGMDARDRAARLHAAFTISPGREVEGAHVVLVDDVFTTGATMNECARTLKAAGASWVGGFTLARVLD
ncbi:MAG: ComF family protein [Acidobacteria bacterium]|nr:ComF family protein [Acidobacteriota bacterium]